MDFINKVKKFSKTALKKGQELGNVAKTKFEISGLKDKIEERKIEIGEIVIENNLFDDNESISNCVKEIKKLQKQIDEKEEQLKK